MVRKLSSPLSLIDISRVLYLQILEELLLFSETVKKMRCMTFADCRPQISDCKLTDTKNLPNKADVIKNITSCESEKVAWEQG